LDLSVFNKYVNLERDLFKLINRFKGTQNVIASEGKYTFKVPKHPEQIRQITAVLELISSEIIKIFKSQVIDKSLEIHKLYENIKENLNLEVEYYEINTYTEYPDLYQYHVITERENYNQEYIDFFKTRICLFKNAIKRNVGIGKVGLEVPILVEHGKIKLPENIQYLQVLIKKYQSILIQANTKSQELAQKLVKLSPLAIKIIKQEDGNFLVSSNPVADPSEADLKLEAQIAGTERPKIPPVINAYQLLSPINNQVQKIKESLQGIKIPKESPQIPELPKFQPKDLLNVNSLKDEIQTFLDELKVQEAWFIDLSEKANKELLNSEKSLGNKLGKFFSKEEKKKTEEEKNTEQQNKILELVESKILADIRTVIYNLETIVEGWENTDIVVFRDIKSLVNLLLKDKKINREAEMSIEELVKVLSLTV